MRQSNPGLDTSNLNGHQAKYWTNDKRHHDMLIACHKVVQCSRYYVASNILWKFFHILWYLTTPPLFCFKDLLNGNPLICLYSFAQCILRLSFLLERQICLANVLALVGVFDRYQSLPTMTRFGQIIVQCFIMLYPFAYTKNFLLF